MRWVRCFYAIVASLIILSSCQEVIEIDLDYSEPVFVAEARIYRDSVCQVILSQTAGYFSTDEPGSVEDAAIIISDGSSSEELDHRGNGYYTGNIITGSEGSTYNIEILREGKTYRGSSFMPAKTEILSTRYTKSDNVSPVNPFGETVFTITCVFADDPGSNNFYLIRFTAADGSLIERYYLLTESISNSGSLENVNDTITFSESIFYKGGEVTVNLFSVDEQVYNYFLQLTDVLFWKRRIEPPTPYNPVSNIDNGIQGYFAAWAYDSDVLVLE